MSKDTIYREDAIKAIKRVCHDNRCLTFIEHINKLSSADRLQGCWTKTDVATYRCSECGKLQIADDVNELNFCCCCGSRNKMWRLKGADDD